MDEYSGDAGNFMMTPASGSLYASNGKYFCASNYDNDQRGEDHYAGSSYVYGGWWIGYYSVSVLNRNAGGMWQDTWTGSGNVQTSRMMVKSK